MNYNADLLPEYKFTGSDVGCSEHDDPNCLCDVRITTITKAEHVPMFGPMADEAVGGVSAETLVKWAGIMLGCYEKHLELDREADQPLPEVHGWQLLPEFNREQLVRSYKDGVKWSQAKVWVPTGFPVEDLKIVAKTYNIRLYTKGANK